MLANLDAQQATAYLPLAVLLTIIKREFPMSHEPLGKPNKPVTRRNYASV